MVNRGEKLNEPRSRPSSARIGKYLEKYLEGFLFDEFKEEYILRQRLDLDFMRGVPIPFRKLPVEQDLSRLNINYMKQDGFVIKELCINMAWILGISPEFPFRNAYIAYIVLFYKEKTLDFLMGLAEKSAELKEYDASSVFYRAALCINAENLAAMFGYAIVCKQIYLSNDDGIRIGDYKAEAFDFFELTTVIHPEFADGYYHLGYAYLNLGLYRKAYLTWKRFLELIVQSDSLYDDNESALDPGARIEQGNSDLPDNKVKREEIKERLSQLSVPIEIEKGYNSVMAGRLDEGISVLEPHLKGRYVNWWPLYYYLGIAYKAKGESDKSEKMFKKVLDINPSHIESMEELAEFYKAAGSDVLYEKYYRKAELIRTRDCADQ